MLFPLSTSRPAPVFKMPPLDTAAEIDQVISRRAVGNVYFPLDAAEIEVAAEVLPWLPEQVTGPLSVRVPEPLATVPLLRVRLPMVLLKPFRFNWLEVFTVTSHAEQSCPLARGGPSPRSPRRR